MLYCVHATLITNQTFQLNYINYFIAPIPIKSNTKHRKELFEYLKYGKCR